jgi:hypothetical protein
MAFCHRVFSRQSALPTLSELLLALRRRGHVLDLADGTAVTALSEPFWQRVLLRAAQEGQEGKEGAFLLERLQREVGTAAALAEELADFREDVDDLAASDGRENVRRLLDEAQAIVRVAFPVEGLGSRGEAAVEILCDILAEQGDGLVQRDGEGFFDVDGDEVLALG